MILKQAGLAEYDPEDRQMRILAVRQARLIELASEAAADTAFGLHLAFDSNPREAGLLFYAFAAANDVRGGLSLLSRYSRVANDSVNVAVVHNPGGATLALSYVGVPRHRFTQIVEFQFAIIVKAFREVTRRNITPTRVRCAHARISSHKEFDRFYGCHVEFSASVDALDLADETLNMPLVTSDQYLLETLRPFCEAATRAYLSGQGPTRASVENEVFKLLPHGRANLETVARALGTSPRTLARRLAGEGTTFARVIENLRRELSLQYLKDSNFTIAQIAWLLGYEQSDSFTHAFRRWSGRPPSQMRTSSTR